MPALMQTVSAAMEQIQATVMGAFSGLMTGIPSSGVSMPTAAMLNAFSGAAQIQSMPSGYAGQNQPPQGPQEITVKVEADGSARDIFDALNMNLKYYGNLGGAQA